MENGGSIYYFNRLLLRRSVTNLFRRGTCGSNSNAYVCDGPEFRNCSSLLHNSLTSSSVLRIPSPSSESAHRFGSPTKSHIWRRGDRFSYVDLGSQLVRLNFTVMILDENYLFRTKFIWILPSIKGEKINSLFYDFLIRCSKNAYR